MFFKRIDIISPKIGLYYNNEKRHSSFFGGLLSLIFILNFLGLLIQYSIFNNLPDKLSLHLYRNYETDMTKEYFKQDELGIFHFFYLYNNNNTEYEDLIRYKNLKNGILHIYMINLLNAFEFNSSNLYNYDHWVYDSCNNYALKEDEKYDYSFSFCIKYYYSSMSKKYFSINDKSNFKYPFFKESYFISENSFFTVFIEKCKNNSFISNIFGKCYPEEIINNFLQIFNSMFISFVDNKIEISDQNNPIKNYSHQIHNNLKNNEEFFSFHEMEFMRFSYKENGVFYKNVEINSFMLEEDKISKIYNKMQNKILAAYSFRFKKYYNEFRKQEHKFFVIFRIISSNVMFVYFIFYCINLFFNEFTQTNNFISFINDNNDTLIQRHINYDKSKIFSIRSNLNSNGTNENNLLFNTLRSSYFGNVKTNANMSNIYFRDNNSKFNKKSEIMDLRENEENNYSKKSENIFFINNGTFMDREIENKNKLNLNIIEKKKSIKFNHKKNEFNEFEKHNIVYSYRKVKEKETNIDISNNNNYIFRNPKEKISDNNSIKNETLDNDSKQKIMNSSSISLLKEMNNQNNTNIHNTNNILQKNELNNFKNDKKYSIYFPLNLYSNNNIKPLNKNKENTNNLGNDKKFSVSTKINAKNFRKNRFNISLIKPNTKSYEKNKHNKTTNLERFNHNKRKESLSNEFIYDNNSQISFPGKSKDNFRKNIHLNKLTGNKISKEKIRHEHETHIKKKKFIDQNSLNVLHTPKNMAKKSLNFDKNKIFTKKNFLNYFCLCIKKNKNAIGLIRDFRKRLLGEEYLYVAHLSLNAFRKKLGLKLFFDKKDLMEELYYDY